MHANLELWEDLYKQDWGSKYPTETLIQFIARKFYRAERENVKLLDIGCGKGANIIFMAAEGFDVYGIDGSKEAISKAQANLEEKKLNATLQSGNIINLPYNDDFFDGVTENEVVYYNNKENSKKILGEVKRVLKKGGYFYSRTFSTENYIGQNYEQISTYEFDNISDGPLSGKGFTRLIDLEGIKELYGSIFEIESIDKLEYTINNGAVTISEWIIICKK